MIATHAWRSIFNEIAAWFGRLPAVIAAPIALGKVPLSGQHRIAAVPAPVFSPLTDYLRQKAVEHLERGPARRW